MIGTLKFDCNVSTTFCGPWLNAALILALPMPGMSTQRSRGNDTAKLWSPSAWSTIIVSERGGELSVSLSLNAW